MALRLVETTISEAAIRMRLADDGDPTKAIEWVEFSVPLTAQLKLPNALGQDIPIGNLERSRLSTLQVATLRYVIDAISNEGRRLEAFAYA